MIASGSALSAAAMPRRAPPEAAPSSLAPGRSGGRAKHMGGDPEPEPRGRPAADRRRPRDMGARRLQRRLAVPEGEGHAFEDRLGALAATGLMADPQQNAANPGVVVRCPLAREIG